MTVIFGYRHVIGVPRCPCGDCGTYMAMEQPGDDPLSVRFRSWCGRAEFLVENGAAPSDNAGVQP